MTIPELYKLFLDNPSVQTDSRKLQPGQMFFALKGENYNGNSFASQAIEQGASYAIVDEDVDATNTRIIRVPNVLACLQQLAKYHRQQFNIPFIAITGSNGKTTTKELVYAVLATTYKTYTTQGNLNNHIGIPLTLLSVKKDAEIAVIEMGANHQKEIASYCEYTLPTHGVITNCGKAHLEGFGGVEGVRKGKGELYDFIRVNGGTVFAFYDYDYLHSMSTGIKDIVWYGTQEGDVIGSVSRNTPFLSVEVEMNGQAFTIDSQLVGDYNLPNVLLAVTIGKYFNISVGDIKPAIENYKPSNSRSQLINWNNNTVILDAYNANPTSMRAAISNFANMPADGKVLLLGAMMELGEESIQEHQSIVDLVKQHTWKDVVLVGGDFLSINHPFHSFNNSKEAAKWLQQQHYTGMHLLIKGSRSTQMEELLSNNT